MSISRRIFLKLSAATAAVAFHGLGFDLETARAQARAMKITGMAQSTSVCCYCAVGCGLLVHVDKGTGRAVNVEGDPDHPINEGTLCPKGASIWQTVEQSPRLATVLYRAPHSDKWEEKTWDWALPRIAGKIKQARDASFEMENAAGQPLRRTRALASVGSAALDNEEGWLYQAMLRALGLVYIESHARI